MSPSKCNRTENGYPLQIEATSILHEETQYDEDLVRKMLSKLDLPAFLTAIRQIAPLCTGKDGAPTLPELPFSTPEEIQQCVESNTAAEEGRVTSLLQSLHTILFDIHIMEGHLICPGTGRKFPVHDGIPNMILHEDEV